MNPRRWCIGFLFAAVAVAQGAGVNWAAVHDSLGDIEPWLRTRWLHVRGLDRDYYSQNSWKPTTDSGLRCVARWSYGPSVRVSIRVTPDDTIVCLARGSGASLIRFRCHDSLTLQLLSDINCSGIVSRAIIDDTLVYCGMNQGGTGIEVWGVNELSSPHRLSYVHLSSVMDIAVKDTFLYSIGYQQDSLRVFNVANPSSPVQIGACADSGINGMCVAGDYCYLADQYGLYVVDVSDPTYPHRVAAIGGFEALAVSVRDTLCYVGTYNGSDFALRVYDVKNPTMPFPVGSLSGIEAHDIYLPPTCDTVLYTPKLNIINIADPASPRQIGFVGCPGWDYGVVAVPALGHALVADYFKGMVAVNISNPAAPLVDTAAFAGDQARDITVSNGKVYLASYLAGLQILDTSVPSLPSYLGAYDSGQAVRSATAKDSFAYVSWPRPRMLTIDVSDPTRPAKAGGCESMFNPPEAMVIRDSFVYCAEVNRFQIVNVARPREPVLVGSCVSTDGVYFGLVLQETLAYVAGGANLEVVSVADPANPRVIGSGGRASSGVAVRDTFAYIPYPYDTLFVYSVTDPSDFRLLSAVPASVWPRDAVLGESRVYVGAGDGIDVYVLRNPAQPFHAGRVSPPCGVRRLSYSGGLLYAALWEGGVAIYETTSVGLAENGPESRLPLGAVSVRPSPASGRISVDLPHGPRSRVRIINAVGREVSAHVGFRLGTSAGDVPVDVSRLRPGVYFVRLERDGVPMSAKFVKR